MFWCVFVAIPGVLCHSFRSVWFVAPKEPHEGGGQEVFTSRYGASKNVGSTCSGDGSYRRLKIEEADGGSSRQEGFDLALFILGSVGP